MGYVGLAGFQPQGPPALQSPNDQTQIPLQPQPVPIGGTSTPTQPVSGPTDGLPPVQSPATPADGPLTSAHPEPAPTDEAPPPDQPPPAPTDEAPPSDQPPPPPTDEAPPPDQPPPPPTDEAPPPDQSEPVSPETSQTTGRLDVPLGIQAINFAFDGTNIWVVGGTGGIVKLLASDGSIQGGFFTGGSPTAALSVGTIIWVANSDPSSSSGNIAALNSSGALGGTVPLEQRAIALASPSPSVDFGPVYFVDVNGDYLWKLDPSAGRITPVGATGVSSGLEPISLLFDGASFWISYLTGNSVSKIDLTGSLLGNFPIGTSSGILAFDGNNIWVTNWNAHVVTKLSMEGEILQTVPAGDSPYGLAFDGANLWVANYYSNTVTKIRASDGAVLDTLATGLNPTGVLFDGVHIWVANSGSNSVSRF